MGKENKMPVFRGFQDYFFISWDFCRYFYVSYVNVKIVNFIRGFDYKKALFLLSFILGITTAIQNQSVINVGYG